jgi:hypothetical protein
MLGKTCSRSRALMTHRTRHSVAITSCLLAALLSLQATNSPTHAATISRPRAFAYYYLWWSADHWKSSLGRNYPVNASPMPLPATLDAGGCGTRSKYIGNHLTDVPSHIYSQDNPGLIESDVRQAAAAGLTGFAVNWAGTGSSTQSTNSNPYSRRLQLLVNAVHKVNAEGIPFSLWLSYRASAHVLPQSHIDNDLRYFVAKYGSDSAFDRAQSQVLGWGASARKFALPVQTADPRRRELMEHDASALFGRRRLLLVVPEPVLKSTVLPTAGLSRKQSTRQRNGQGLGGPLHSRLQHTNRRRLVVRPTA